MTSVGQRLTRRSVLGAGVGALTAALAGCTGVGEPSPSGPTSSASPGPDGGSSETRTSTPPPVTAARTAASTSTGTPTAPSETAEANGSSPTPTSTPGSDGWRAVELTDVVTEERFTIQQFEGQPVLLEFFAVWCPVCTKQQKVLKDVTAELEELVVVSLNTDPNESAARVREHLEQHEGFDWRYAVAPSTMTRSLIDEFGSVIANPPAAPIVRVCPDGTARLLDGHGVKPADALVAAVERC